jgi:hypothetical protein
VTPNLTRARGRLALEAVAAPGSDLEPERREIERLRSELAIEDAALVAGSRCDMLVALRAERS